MRAILGFLALVSAGAAHAAPSDFTCRNGSAQISCAAAACEVETSDFTPMSVSRTGARLEVCAYSGCWSGPLDLIRIRGDHTILHAVLARNQGGVTLTYGRRTRIATMLWGNFAQPLNCGDQKANN